VAPEVVTAYRPENWGFEIDLKLSENAEFPASTQCQGDW
jgi:hypothetical protein